MRPHLHSHRPPPKFQLHICVLKGQSAPRTRMFPAHRVCCQQAGPHSCEAQTAPVDSLLLPFGTLLNEAVSCCPVGQWPRAADLTEYRYLPARGLSGPWPTLCIKLLPSSHTDFLKASLNIRSIFTRSQSAPLGEVCPLSSPNCHFPL